MQRFVHSTMVFLHLKLRFSTFPYVSVPSSVSLWLVIVCFTTTILLSWGRPFLRLPIGFHSRILEFVNPSLYTVIRQLTKIIRSGITFVSRNLR